MLGTRPSLKGYQVKQKLANSNLWGNKNSFPWVVWITHFFIKFCTCCCVRNKSLVWKASKLNIRLLTRNLEMIAFVERWTNKIFHKKTGVSNPDPLHFLSWFYLKPLDLGWFNIDLYIINVQWIFWPFDHGSSYRWSFGTLEK